MIINYTQSYMCSIIFLINVEVLLKATVSQKITFLHTAKMKNIHSIKLYVMAYYNHDDSDQAWYRYTFEVFLVCSLLFTFCLTDQSRICSLKTINKDIKLQSIELLTQSLTIHLKR